MKFILTGCTGFIGSEVLSQCLRNPAITSIVALSRRPLPESVTNNPKLKILIIKDFTSYPESILRELSGADACIWCMGTTAGIKELEIDYPLAFGNAFSKTLAKTGQKFRYLHLSGAVTERNPDASLWYKGKMRKLKGQAEENMLAFASKSEIKGQWETLIVKAGYVFSAEGYNTRNTIGWLVGSSKAIRKDELAAAMIDSALSGWKGDTWADNQAMVDKGREYLAKMQG